MAQREREGTVEMGELYDEDQELHNAITEMRKKYDAEKTEKDRLEKYIAKLEEERGELAKRKEKLELSSSTIRKVPTFSHLELQLIGSKNTVKQLSFRVRGAYDGHSQPQVRYAETRHNFLQKEKVILEFINQPEGISAKIKRKPIVYLKIE